MTTMEKSKSSLERSFQSCSFGTVRNVGDSSPETSHCVTSFFVDSSGRSSFTLPLQMAFASKNDLDELLTAKCFDPPPRNLDSGMDSVEDDNNNNVSGNDGSIASNKGGGTKAFVAFEVKSFPIDGDDQNQVTVEGVSVLSCVVKNLVVTFRAEMTVRAALRDSFPEGARMSNDLDAPTTPSFCSSPRQSDHSSAFGDDYDSEHESKERRKRHQINVSTRLEITPILTIENITIAHSKENNKNSFCPDLMLLELAAIPDQMQCNENNEANDKVHEARLAPASIDLVLTNAFTISVKSLSGSNSQTGKNLVSLTIRHSKTHDLPVTITNIALHPGHSRHHTFVAQNKTKSNKAKAPSQHLQQTVSNMTESVEWGYAPKTELKLPFTMLPHEAYSSILFINAGEEGNSRQFISPLSVTGVIVTNTSSGNKVEGDDAHDGREECRVVVAGDAHWTTNLIAVEPKDAFRIEMCVLESTVRRGEPMSVKLRIFNLSSESKTLVLFMAKRDPDREISKAGVVSESDGYKFNVLGISGDEDGTARLNRNQDLLAIDTELVLGDVKGQHAVDAELRFVPLHLGRLKVPNWRLYDKGGNQWYSCKHDLDIVAV
mmetsp:Transcript_14129/g.32798  ORF Transcript_14129/g.32798 Transcript_14129/m.32798 type:complete len:604 (+) Transcript_14129:152-1963(+)